ncbi:MAG: DNA adenine methylase [Planctomycetaceae bacterium]|nr:DNA adenine methylase [Planctomycetaceae bacterium]
MAPEIVRELGKHGQYFEPFCGSMAVLMAKEPSQKETVNDLHGDLINLARVIQSETAAEMLYDRLQKTLFSEDLLECAREKLDGDGDIGRRLDKPYDDVCDVERAYWYFLACWMGRNGTAGTARLDYQIAVRWTKGGGSPTVRFRNAVDSLPQWHQRLRNVVILKRDAFKILDRFEDCEATAIYADPPYVDTTRSKGAIKNGRGGKYLHEFEHGGGMFGDDHDKLAEILRGYRKARIVVSYYDTERVRELYKGWTIVDHTRQKHLHAQNGRGARPKEAPEILLINGPSYATN